jgi:ferredoxin
VPYIKRVKSEKLAARLENPEEYNKLFTADEIERLFSEVLSYYIDPEKCQACLICASRCPVGAIVGGRNRIHVIDQDQCIKCEICLEVGPSRFGAVTKITGGPVPPALPEEKRIIVRKARAL